MQATQIAKQQEQQKLLGKSLFLVYWSLNYIYFFLTVYINNNLSKYTIQDHFISFQIPQSSWKNKSTVIHKHFKYIHMYYKMLLSSFFFWSSYI